MHSVDMVHRRRQDRGTSGCGASWNHGAALDPVEVLAPLLFSGVEQGHDHPTVRIERFGLVRLVAVAERTGQDEVTFVVCAATRLGNDVVDLQVRADNPLRGLAIAAAIE